MNNKIRVLNKLVFCSLVLTLHIPVSAQFLSNAVREFNKGGKHFGRVLDKAGKDASKATVIALHNIGTATGAAANNAKRMIEKRLKDTSVTAGKAGKDLVTETGRVGSDALDARKAIGKFLATSITGSLESIAGTERRIEDGKLLDAIFHIALDPLRTHEEAAFQATQESRWLNTIGAAAASAYGGPAGAAAYATWQTYKTSGGNPELALRSGIITGLTSSSRAGIGGMSPGNTAEIFKKSVLAGAVAGLDTAASGGNADQIRDGFILGLVNSIVHPFGNLRVKP